MLRWKF